MSKIDATVLKDGQLAVATLEQSGTLISCASAIDTTCLVQTEDCVQQCVKTFPLGEGGGGGGGGADTSLSNLTAAGKEVAGAMSLPGSVIEELTVPPADTMITAPANGYFTFSRRAEKSGNSVELSNQTSGVFSRMFGTHTNALGRVFVPCMKNDSIFVRYDGNNTNNQTLTFTYAKGSEPQQ